MRNNFPATFIKNRGKMKRNAHGGRKTNLPGSVPSRPSKMRASTYMKSPENGEILRKCVALGYGWTKIKNLYYTNDSAVLVYHLKSAGHALGLKVARKGTTGGGGADVGQSVR